MHWVLGTGVLCQHVHSDVSASFDISGMSPNVSGGGELWMTILKRKRWSSQEGIGLSANDLSGRSQCEVCENPSVWYDMCIDSLSGTLWVEFHGWYWYQSFIDGSNIWGVERNDPWSPEMDHPPLGRSYFVVVPSYDMSCALILLTGLYGWDYMADIDINPSSMGPIFGL